MMGPPKFYVKGSTEETWHWHKLKPLWTNRGTSFLNELSKTHVLEKHGNAISSE